MSIVRIGLAETKNFADGYDAIFGKKKAEKKEAETPTAKDDAAKKKPAKKKGKK